MLLFTNILLGVLFLSIVSFCLGEASFISVQNNRCNVLWLIKDRTEFFFMARQPYMGLGLLVSSRSHDHTHLRHTTLARPPLDE
jgi:hypothetical protein